MTKKRILAVVVAAAVAATAMLTLVSCGNGGGDGGSANGAVATLEEGKFLAGMEIGYPPMEYLDEDGSTPIGFDVDVAAELATRLGDLEIEYVDTAWDGIFSSLDSNRYDAIISSVSITDDRKENYELTKPYIANRIVIVAQKGSGIESPEDLTGRSVATQTETTADIWMAEQQENGLELSGYFEYDKIIMAFDELKIGRVDAVAVDEVVALYYIQTSGDTLEVVWSSPESEPLGICLKKGNTELLAAIESALDDMYADGTMATISTKHFGKDVTEGVR